MKSCLSKLELVIPLWSLYISAIVQMVINIYLFLLHIQLLGMSYIVNCLYWTLLLFVIINSNDSGLFMLALLQIV